MHTVPSINTTGMSVIFPVLLSAFRDNSLLKIFSVPNIIQDNVPVRRVMISMFSISIIPPYIKLSVTRSNTGKHCK